MEEVVDVAKHVGYPRDN
jgi:hypothetical protein